MKGITYKIIFSSRRTLAISILPDATVIVRAPYRTPGRTIEKLINDRSSWILKHTENIRIKSAENPVRKYVNGEKHLYRGAETTLRIGISEKPYCKFNGNTIELGISEPDDPAAVRQLLYSGYRKEAVKLFPETLDQILKEKESFGFKVTKLNIRTMKSRWGSCSGKGVITLNTELVRLPHKYLRYVILHELGHLKEHNHGPGFYRLLTELAPDWKEVRKELRRYGLGG